MYCWFGGLIGRVRGDENAGESVFPFAIIKGLRTDYDVIEYPHMCMFVKCTLKAGKHLACVHLLMNIC